MGRRPQATTSLEVAREAALTLTGLAQLIDDRCAEEQICSLRVVRRR